MAVRQKIPTTAQENGRNEKNIDDIASGGRMPAGGTVDGTGGGGGSGVLGADRDL